MYGGHDAHAEVDQPALIPHPEAAILRHAALRNVELAHDLDARQNRLVVFARNRRHGLLQHAVNPVLHQQTIVERLQVNIRRAAFQRSEDGRIHQPDDRRNIIIGGQLFDRDILVGVLLAREHVERQTFARLIQHALRLLVLLQQIRNLAQRCHTRDNVYAQQPGNLVDDHQLRRVGNRNRKPALALFQRHEVVAEHHVHGHGLEELDLDREVLQVDKLGMIAPRKQLRALNLGERLIAVRNRDGDGGHRCWTH